MDHINPPQSYPSLPGMGLADFAALDSRRFAGKPAPLEREEYIRSVADAGKSLAAVVHNTVELPVVGGTPEVGIDEIPPVDVHRMCNAVAGNNIHSRPAA